MTGQEIVLRPLFDLDWLAPILLLAFVPAVYGLIKGVSGSWWRLAATLVVALALLNPRLVIEERRALNDIAVVVVDESASQEIAGRLDQTRAAAEALKADLTERSGLETRIVTNTGADNTNLFTALDRALATAPRERLAAVMMVTDGQIHDVPDQLELGAPLHLLLTGTEEERDRRITVVSTAGYGIVGATVEVVVRVEDPAMRPGELVSASLVTERDGRVALTLPANQDQALELPVTRAGDILAELSVAPAEGELSTVNNTTVLRVNGVRDRLRVLLISGEPHPGERAWRNLLKSDPGVDLVHFTILRPPEKQDATPLRELALIPFPIRELFEVKLPQFDLVIFDRYRLRGVLPALYIERISDYVLDGGAVLLAAGPEYAEIHSLHNTALGRILPARPTGEVFEDSVKPRLTETGKRHPVTADLPGGRAEPPTWGRWHRQIPAEPERGQVLLDGLQNRPILVLDRRGDGRVAQILSDHLWLWQRGYDGGGPQAELMRRLSHWLMGEPDLEEERLETELLGGELLVRRHSIGPGGGSLTLQSPTGEEIDVTFETERPGIDVVRVPITTPGLYRVESRDEAGSVLAAVVAPGDGVSKELADLRARPGAAAVLAEASGGAVRRLADGVPSIRMVDRDRQAHGAGWIGLRDNGQYAVAGLTDVPLLPGFLLLLLGLVALVFTWRREGA